MINPAAHALLRAISTRLPIAVALAALPAPAQQLTARELFYKAAQVAASPKPATPKPAPPKVTKAPQRPPVQIAANEAPTTAPMPANGEPPLGLRYTVQRYRDDGTTDVPADNVFHSGDKIRVNVQATERGYLYIVNRGTSGTWKPMFPSPEIENGDNHVEPMRDYAMPPGNHVFTFEGTPGTENLFVIFSRKPEPDLESVIYSLQAKPNAPAQSSKALVQAVNIPNDEVDRLRSAYSRDLIIEKVDPTTPGAKKETAVYVVNPTGSADSRVVADLHLVHQ